MATILKIF